MSATHRSGCGWERSSLVCFFALLRFRSKVTRGTRSLELHKRTGHEELANKQAQLNTRLKKAVVQMVARGT